MRSGMDEHQFEEGEEAIRLMERHRDALDERGERILALQDEGCGIGRGCHHEGDQGEPPLMCAGELGQAVEVAGVEHPCLIDHHGRASRKGPLGAWSIVA